MIGTGTICIGRVGVFVRANERLYSNSVGGITSLDSSTSVGLWGSGRSSNHPLIPELYRGLNDPTSINYNYTDSTWDNLFKGDSQNDVLTKRACSGIESLAFDRLKRIGAKDIIESSQFDSGINQYRFYNFLKRKLQYKDGVKDTAQNAIIGDYEQNFGKPLEKTVYLDVYCTAYYDDESKTISISGGRVIPAFPHVVAAQWYPFNQQENYSYWWGSILSGIDSSNYFTNYAAPDPTYNGFTPAEKENTKINDKYKYAWSYYETTPVNY